MNMRNILKAAVSLSALAFACAPSVTTIDRTQPNALAKSQFEGIWYYRSMVTEADPEAGQTEGITSNTDKIRWEIQENQLVGYRTYEFLPYAEGLTDEGRDFFGSPVVAYAILSHFDIQRDYSTTTGIETNVVVENSTDRPWYERQYIRVDWSKNTVGTPTKMWTGWTNYPDAFFSATALTAYYNQGNVETDPERPWITEDYMDVTNRFSLEPDEYYCGLYLLSQSVPRCGGGNVKARLSFRKVDPAGDYEPLYYPDNVELKDNEGNAIVLNYDGRSCEGRDPAECSFRVFPYDAAFGNFRILRVAFDQERFLTRTGRIFQAGRFNLWERSKNDEGGSIAYEARTPKPIIYYGNVHFPKDIVPAAQKIAQHWNEPFAQTVAHLKGYTIPAAPEGQDKNPDTGRADTQRLRNEMGQDMFQFRENTCSTAGLELYVKGDEGLKLPAHPAAQDVIDRIAGNSGRIGSGNIEQVCAAIQFAELEAGATLDPKVAQKTGAPLAFTWQRKGDLRYNFQNYIEQVAVYGPWGVAQFGQDPETGEFIGANIANYFGTAGDSISQKQVDLIQWMNGELSEDELFRGDIARREVVSRRGTKNNSIRQSLLRDLATHEGDMLAASGDRLFAGDPSPGAEDSRFRQMFKGTDIEREVLVTDDILRTFAGPSLYQPTNGGQPNASPGAVVGNAAPGEITAEALEAASPVNWGMTPQNNEFMKAAYEFGRRAVDMAEFFDPNTSGMADYFRNRPREEILQELRLALYESVNAHEVGHTVGLRHNFEASMDALSYQDKFWKAQPNAEGTLEGPYWNNPPTAQNKHRGNELKYGSIMDYGFDVSLEGLTGIGNYDKAAIRFMYGQLVDVWDNTKVSIPDPRKYKSFARRCGHDSDFWGFAGMQYYMGPEHLPQLLSQSPKRVIDEVTGMEREQTEAEKEACAADFDAKGADLKCDSGIDSIYRDMVSRLEADAAAQNRPTDCWLVFTNINEVMAKIQELPANANNIVDARKTIKVSEVIEQKVALLGNPPEYDDPTTNPSNSVTRPDLSVCTGDEIDNDPNCKCVAGDESKDCIDNDICQPGAQDDNSDGVCPDGKVDDKGYDYSKYYSVVPYAYCSDLYAGFSNPFCQRWDTGWDFKEATEAHINRWDRDYIFDHFRRDAFSPVGWGSGRSYMARLLSRRFYHMTNVFRFYLYTRRSTFAAPRYKDWQEAAYKGLNFLERVLQDPEPGTYCLDTTANKYVPQANLAQGATCDQPFEVGLGNEAGKYLNNSWTDEYFYKSNRIGSYYDKLAAVWQITTSSGFFARDVSDLFDRRSFSLGYPRVYLDPMVQRFAALIQGDHTGYRPRVVTDADTQERYVHYTPFFDEERLGPDGITPLGSMRQWLEPMPEIEPSWSWNLQYMSLAYAMANWSSVNDYTPEFYRFTKISIAGTPEDVTYGSAVQVVEFTDPETLVTYRAPVIEPFSAGGLRSEFPAYYGDAAYKRLGKYRQWSIGANVLTEANNYKTTIWGPDKAECENPAITGEAHDLACQKFERARQGLNERVGFIDRMRKFNYRAEGL